MKIQEARRIALSLPEVTEQPHFEISSFRVRRKITLHKALALLLLAVLVACAPVRADSPQPRHRIAYSTEDSLQFGDLALPPGSGPFPLAVVIHGGCWLARVGSLDSTAALAGALTHAGVATWNIEYRRVGNRGGGWPGTFLDVGAATDYAKTLAKSYPLDLGRVVVVGHSAGAHLALWVAARAKLPKSSELRRESPLSLRGVVALAPPTDLRAIAESAGGVCGDHTLERLIGGTPEAVPEHYAQASPAALLPFGVRQVLVAGSEDRLIPTRLVAAYESAARKMGDPVELDEIHGADHLDLVAPEPPAWPTVRDKVLELVK